MQRFLVLFVAIVGLCMPASANELVDRLTGAMRLDEVVEVLREEGVSSGKKLDEGFLGGAGGAFFQAQIEDIYDPVWMTGQISESLSGMLTEQQLEQAATFFESDLGQVIVSLENSARRAMMDEAVTQMAQAALRDADRDGGRFLLIEEYIEVNDLIARNVQSTITSDYSFFRGMANGQGTPPDEGHLLAELLAHKDEVERDTRDWLFSFLMLAYQPLDEAQIRGNIAFSRTDTGRALNDAIFDGIDKMYNEISYQLGITVGQVLGASEL